MEEFWWLWGELRLQCRYPPSLLRIISSSKLLHASKQDVIVAILAHLHRRAMQEEEFGFEDDERAAMGQVSRFEEELMMEEQEGQRMAMLQAQVRFIQFYSVRLRDINSLSRCKPLKAH